MMPDAGGPPHPALSCWAIDGQYSETVYGGADLSGPIQNYSSLGGDNTSKMS